LNTLKSTVDVFGNPLLDNTLIPYGTEGFAGNARGIRCRRHLRREEPGVKGGQFSGVHRAAVRRLLADARAGVRRDGGRSGRATSSHGSTQRVLAGVLVETDAPPSLMAAQVEAQKLEPKRSAPFDAFAGHREHLTALVKNAARPGAQERLCVLGAETASIWTSRISQVYREIHLVDIDEAALEGASERQPRRSGRRSFATGRSTCLAWSRRSTAGGWGRSTRPSS
jgi:hypothetical protein